MNNRSLHLGKLIVVLFLILVQCPLPTQRPAEISARLRQLQAKIKQKKQQSFELEKQITSQRKAISSHFEIGVCKQSLLKVSQGINDLQQKLDEVVVQNNQEQFYQQSHQFAVGMIKIRRSASSDQQSLENAHAISQVEIQILKNEILGQPCDKLKKNLVALKNMKFKKQEKIESLKNLEKLIQLKVLKENITTHLKMQFLVKYQQLAQDEVYQCQFLMQSNKLPTSTQIIQQAQKNKCYMKAIHRNNVIIKRGSVIKMVQEKNRGQIFSQLTQRHQRLDHPQPYYRKVIVAYAVKNIFCTVTFFMTDPQLQAGQEEIFAEYKRLGLDKQLQQMARSHPAFPQQLLVSEQVAQGEEQKSQRKKKYKIVIKPYGFSQQKVTKQFTSKPAFKCQIKKQFIPCIFTLHMPIMQQYNNKSIQASLNFFIQQKNKQKVQQIIQQRSYKQVLRNKIKQAINFAQECQIPVFKQKFTVLCHQGGPKIFFNSDLLQSILFTTMLKTEVQALALKQKLMQAHPLKVSIRRDQLETMMWYQVNLIKLQNTKPKQPTKYWKDQLSRKQKKKQEQIASYVEEHKVILVLKYMMSQLVQEQKTRNRHFYKRVMKEDPPTTTAEQGFLRGLLKNKQPPNVLLKPFILKHLPQGHNPIIYPQKLSIFKTYQQEEIEVTTDDQPLAQFPPFENKIQIKAYGNLQKPLFLSIPLLKQRNSVPIRFRPYALGPVKQLQNIQNYYVTMKKSNFRIFFFVSFMMQSTTLPTCDQVYKQAIRLNLLQEMQRKFYSQLASMNKKNPLYGQHHTLIECPNISKTQLVQALQIKLQKIKYRSNQQQIIHQQIPKTQLEQLNDKLDSQYTVHVMYAVSFKDLTAKLFMSFLHHRKIITPYQIENKLKHMLMFKMANKLFNKESIDIKRSIKLLQQNYYRLNKQEQQALKKTLDLYQSPKYQLQKQFIQTSKQFSKLPTVVIKKWSIQQQFNVSPAEMYFCSGNSMMGRLYEFQIINKQPNQKQVLQLLLKSEDKALFQKMMKAKFLQLNSKQSQMRHRPEYQIKEPTYYFIKLLAQFQGQVEQHQIQFIQDYIRGQEPTKIKPEVIEDKMSVFKSPGLDEFMNYYQILIYIVTNLQFGSISFYMPLESTVPPSEQRIYSYAKRHFYINGLKKMVKGEIKRVQVSGQYKQQLKSIMEKYAEETKRFGEDKAKLTNKQRQQRMKMLKEIAFNMTQYRKSANTQEIKIRILNPVPVNSQLLLQLELNRVIKTVKAVKSNINPLDTQTVVQVTMLVTQFMFVRFVFNVGPSQSFLSKKIESNYQTSSDQIIRILIQNNNQFQLLSMIEQIRKMSKSQDYDYEVQATVVGKFKKDFFRPTFKKYFSNSVQDLMLRVFPQQQDSEIRSNVFQQQKAYFTMLTYLHDWGSGSLLQGKLIYSYKLVQLQSLKEAKADIRTSMTTFLQSEIPFNDLKWQYQQFDSQYNNQFWITSNVRFRVESDQKTKMHQIKLRITNAKLYAQCVFYYTGKLPTLTKAISLTDDGEYLEWILKTMGKLQYLYEQVGNMKMWYSKREILFQILPSKATQQLPKAKCSHSPYPYRINEWKQSIGGAVVGQQLPLKFMQVNIKAKSKTGLYITGMIRHFLPEKITTMDLYLFLHGKGVIHQMKGSYYWMLHKYEIDASEGGTLHISLQTIKQDLAEKLTKKEMLYFREISHEEIMELEYFKDKQSIIEKSMEVQETDEFQYEDKLDLNLVEDVEDIMKKHKQVKSPNKRLLKVPFDISVAQQYHQDKRQKEKFVIPPFDPKSKNKTITFYRPKKPPPPPPRIPTIFKIDEQPQSPPHFQPPPPSYPQSLSHPVILSSPQPPPKPPPPSYPQPPSFREHKTSKQSNGSSVGSKQSQPKDKPTQKKDPLTYDQSQRRPFLSMPVSPSSPLSPLSPTSPLTYSPSEIMQQEQIFHYPDSPPPNQSH